MRRDLVYAIVGLWALALGGCSRPSAEDAARSSCRACVADADCSNETCVQLAEDAVCARSCGSDSDCASDDRCVSLTSAEGTALKACVARDGQCGALPDSDSGAPDAGNEACARYQAPDVANTCCHCSPGKTCSPNNCYGGWVCDAPTCRCMPLPSTCGPPPASNDDALHAGGAVTANVTVKGGTMNRLHFAVVGDTRPAVLNDTNHYPTAIIGPIYQALQDASPRPAFVVTTGDYVFATPASNQAAPQFVIYLQSRAKFSGPIFPAIGNHECTGFTASNCGPGIGSGETSNYREFVTKMLGPLGETKPYYKRRVDAADGSWTAKFVVIAPNSWSDAQGTWLEQALSEPTTYTFLVRHEPTGGGADGSTPAPGVAPSETIALRHPLTLELEGHSHTWMYPRGTKELIVGNGGAPMTGSAVFGYTILSQRTDGAIVVTNYSVSDKKPVFTFAVKPDGSPAN